MSDEMGQLNLFSEEKKKTATTVDKMESFGSAEDSANLIFNEEMLESLNSQDIDNIVEIIEPGSLEEKTNNDISLSKLQQKKTQDFQQPTEVNANNNETQSVGTSDKAQKLLECERHGKLEDGNHPEKMEPLMPQKNTDVTVFANELSDKLDTLGAKTLSYGKKLLILSLSVYQDKVLYRKFEKGDLVQAGDFLYLLYNDELMVYKYVGNNTNLVIPDYVGDLPVRYLYKGFLSKNFLDNHKVRGFISYFKEDNVLELSTDKLAEASHGIKQIQLPVELVQIPGYAFSGCYSLDTIIVPKSVKVLSPNAFESSGIKNIYFQGSAPKNSEALHLHLDMNLFCYPEYMKSFSKLKKESDKVVSAFLAEKTSLDALKQQVKEQSQIGGVSQ